jgi:hypothetical protein
MSDEGVVAFLKGLFGGEPPPTSEGVTEQGGKPWEDPSLAPPAPSPAPVESPSPTPAPAVQPGSEIEDIIGALDKRNRSIADRYGE